VNPTSPLAGKSVFVTGGARRLGRAIALTLAKAGAEVAISYLSSEAEALETTAAIAALGRRSIAVPCDVRSETSVRSAIAQVTAGFRRLDILVNNAAVFASAALESLTLDQWDTVFETNSRGPFLVAREALPHLRTARGRIINMGSLGGLHAWAGHAHYCASKAALHMLTQAMAKAFAPDVSVNCVAPGWIAMQDGPQDVAQENEAIQITRHPILCKAKHNEEPHYRQPASPPKPQWAATATRTTSLRPSSSFRPARTSSPAKPS
jgi:NAD(P)-dependent dehydrogenase (short-subunit alcohol dehydrogenase family)